MDVMDAGSRKKRKILHEPPEDNEVLRRARQLVLEEVDLEVGIRQRLEETIHSRITWALMLQKTLESSGYRIDQAPDSNDDYQNAALIALQASEAPILPILSREAQWDAIPRSRPESDLAPTESTPTPPPPPPTPTPPYTQRSSARHSRQRPASSFVPPPKRHLFLRNTVTTPPTIAKLACPDCLRADFPKVQGLLNHCRIRHGREFGSHDECIRQCAVHVPPEEEAWVVENGVEQAEVSLPSLRRLFEMAVGEPRLEAAVEEDMVDGTSVSEDTPEDTDAPRHSEPSEDPLDHPPVNKASVNTSTHLSRTLGHHIDTPALAAFLGRAPKRRCIAILDEDDEVDILEGIRPTEEDTKSSWHVTLTHRSLARPALDAVDHMQRMINQSEDLDEPVPASLPKSLIVQAQLPPDGEGSRFHITAHMSISDRSLWIPTGM
ncbi:hypothetical protein OF83DRAFT_1178296 [Amylostereum chailletii]|nr:hypothetical protein OF83DRAFT_1178296 [Amylostereum chailletii]